MKRYRPWSPTQAFLLPPSPMEWLPEGHLAYFVLEVAQALDLSEIEDAIQEKDGRGERPYPPAMMVALLVYGYSVGVFSSRRLFVQALRLCQKAGLVKLGHVAFDGTKVKASASKHKAMSHKRMQEEEKRLQAAVKALLARADSADAQEDGRYGPGQDAEDLPAELQRRESRLARIQEAKAEAEARKHHDDGDGGPGGGAGGYLPRHRVPAKPDGTLKPGAQRNFTDPESRIMVKGGEFLQGYNAQAAAPANRPPSQAQQAREAMAAKLATAAGKTACARRSRNRDRSRGRAPMPVPIPRRPPPHRLRGARQRAAEPKALRAPSASPRGRAGPTSGRSVPRRRAPPRRAP